VFINCRLRRSVALCAIACAALIPATGGAAFAAADPPTQESYYSSYGTPDESRSLAREAYYSSYGQPEPVGLPQSAVPSDETPWLPIAVAFAGALIIVAASATQARRLRFRRRRAARATL
jgi:hypothetical protein